MQVIKATISLWGRGLNFLPFIAIGGGVAGAIGGCAKAVRAGAAQKNPATATLGAVPLAVIGAACGAGTATVAYISLPVTVPTFVITHALLALKG
jgi:hypothetical protein